jgi:hypothetical protein
VAFVEGDPQQHWTRPPGAGANAHGASAMGCSGPWGALGPQGVPSIACGGEDAAATASSPSSSAAAAAAAAARPASFWRYSGMYGAGTVAAAAASRAVTSSPLDR